MYLDDKETWKEELNPYYRLIDDQKIVEKILSEFSCNVENGCILNGHIPVKKGLDPLRANGRVFLIDGGFAKNYQKETGIAGYSLVQNSYGFVLIAHEPFESKEKAAIEETDIYSSLIARRDISERILTKNSDEGEALRLQIKGLKALVNAYSEGYIVQEKYD